MHAIRDRLNGASLLILAGLLGAFFALRGRLPDRLPTRAEAGGEALTWADRDAFFAVQLGALALILLFTILIDRVLLRRYGDTAFIAAVALFMALICALTLLPALLFGLNLPWAGRASWAAALLAALGLIGAYALRMRTLRREGLREEEKGGYYRRIRPGWLFAFLPPAYPFLPFSVSADGEGLRVKGALMDCRWPWSRVASVSPGRRAQAYAGMAVRLTASGREVAVVELMDQRWPVVLNAPDREDFLRAVGEFAPDVRLGGEE